MQLGSSAKSYFRVGRVTLRFSPLREQEEDISALLDCAFIKHTFRTKKPAQVLNGYILDLLA
jgi:transcriptional regulator with PAS, ATPase and Fis domain